MILIEPHTRTYTISMSNHIFTRTMRYNQTIHIVCAEQLKIPMNNLCVAFQSK